MARAYEILVESTPNSGNGYAVRVGMCGAGGGLRLFMDADHSISIVQPPRC